jgi:hypothetical protein
VAKEPGERCDSFTDCKSGQCLSWEQGVRRCCRNHTGNEWTRCDYLLAAGPEGVDQGGDLCEFNEQCKEWNNDAHAHRTSCRLSSGSPGELKHSEKPDHKTCRAARDPGITCYHGSDCKSHECLSWEQGVKRCCRESSGNEWTRCDFLLANIDPNSQWAGDLCEFNEQCKEHNNSDNALRTSCRVAQGNEPHSAKGSSWKTCRTAKNAGERCYWGSDCKSGECLGWEYNVKRCCRLTENNEWTRCHELEEGDLCQYTEQCKDHDQIDEDDRMTCRMFEGSKQCRGRGQDHEVCSGDDRECQSNSCGWYSDEDGIQRCCPTMPGTRENWNFCLQIPDEQGCHSDDQCVSNNCVRNNLDPEFRMRCKPAT